MQNSSNEEWISVSELAAILGISKQQVYNRVKAGLYPSKEFKRGSMKGILVSYPKRND